MKVSCSVVFFACESFDWHLEQTQLGFVWFLENGLYPKLEQFDLGAR